MHDAARPFRSTTALLAAALLAACAGSPPAAEPPAPTVILLPMPPADLPAAAESPFARELPNPGAAVLAWADRARQLPPPELQAELARLQALPPTPAALTQLALGWLQARQPGDTQRAGQALARVLQAEGEDARALAPLARLLQAQAAEARRLEEQLERQAQQLRESQRRAEQLADRLDALRAIERSRPRNGEVR